MAKVQEVICSPGKAGGFQNVNHPRRFDEQIRGPFKGDVYPASRSSCWPFFSWAAMYSRTAFSSLPTVDTYPRAQKCCPT